MRTLLL